MHDLAAGFVLAYHGCDKATADKLVTGEAFKPSKNKYDWLGGGIYFWQENPKRALDFAQGLGTTRPGKPYKHPCVVGAVIDLGYCLDLSTQAGIEQVEASYSAYIDINRNLSISIPTNDFPKKKHYLDRAVIDFTHSVRKVLGDQPFDSVRGIFIEGSPIYADSAFHKETHVQICVCDPKNIKGVFHVNF